MQLRQARYFLALGRTLDVARAAASCNATQPALMRGIQRLENEFGVSLLAGESGGIALTPLAHAMMPHVDAMLAAAESARAAAGERLNPQPVRLRVGLGPEITPMQMLDVTERLTSFFPEASVWFEETDAVTLVEALLADTLDCALIAGPASLPDRLQRWKLVDEHCVVVMPAGHALAASDSLDAEALSSETLLLGDARGGFVHRLLEITGRAFAIRRCSGIWSQTLDLVAAGAGLALLPNSLSLPPGLASRPLAAPALRRCVLLTAPTVRPQSTVVATFLKMCRANAFDWLAGAA